MTDFGTLREKGTGKVGTTEGKDEEVRNEDARAG